MKTSELRELSIEALNEKLLEQMKEQFTLRIKNATAKVSKNHQFAEIRRTVARVKTVIHEKKLKGEVA